MRLVLLALMAVMHWNCFAGMLQPKDHFFQSSDDVSLHYVEAGEGSLTLVFIPGWLMPADIFRQQITVLSQSYRVIVLDPRGQGLSQVVPRKMSAESRARDVGELLSQAGVKEYVLLGWSLGVMETLDYLNRYEHRGLRGLVLIDNSIGMGLPVSRRNTGHKRPTTDDAFRTYIEKFTLNMFFNDPPPGMVKTIISSALKLPPASAWQLLNKPYPREYYRQAVTSVKVPVWYAITPNFADQGEALKAEIPGATVTIFQQAGHALFVDQATKFNEELERFLGKI